MKEVRQQVPRRAARRFRRRQRPPHQERWGPSPQCGRSVSLRRSTRSVLPQSPSPGAEVASRLAVALAPTGTVSPSDRTEDCLTPLTSRYAPRDTSAAEFGTSAAAEKAEACRPQPAGERRAQRGVDAHGGRDSVRGHSGSPEAAERRCGVWAAVWNRSVDGVIGAMTGLKWDLWRSPADADPLAERRFLSTSAANSSQPSPWRV